METGFVDLPGLIFQESFNHFLDLEIKLQIFSTIFLALGMHSILEQHQRTPAHQHFPKQKNHSHSKIKGGCFKS